MAYSKYSSFSNATNAARFVLLCLFIGLRCSKGVTRGEALDITSSIRIRSQETADSLQLQIDVLRNIVSFRQPCRPALTCPRPAGCRDIRLGSAS
jgi:hypothetical protein